MSNSQHLIAALIAKGFSHAMRIHVPLDIDRINELNRDNPHAPCASHAFTPANRHMETAFSAVIGRPPASYLQDDALLWHDAWTLARLCGFSQIADIEELAGLRQECGDACTLLELRERYPQIAEWPMGEGCTALRLDFSDGSYSLLTDVAESYVPEPGARCVHFGLYANQGDELRTPEILPVSQAQAMIDFRVALVSEPRTVYDYFVREMRAAPSENLSLIVPLTSRCGAVCAEAIDLASGLIGHVHSSGDGIESYRDSDRIVAITRRALSNYINVRLPEPCSTPRRKCG